MLIRPATASDAARMTGASGAEPCHQWRTSLLPDHWRDDGNRRSFVAVDEAGVILGHCRGIDNAWHPGSRTLVLETRPGPDSSGAEDELLAAQVAVSAAPLHLKAGADDHAMLALARRAGAVAIQAMPPWRHMVGPELRAWADVHRGAAHPVPGDSPELRALEVEHYRAQHAAWSPAAAPGVLAELLAEDEPELAVVLRRDGALVAGGFLWPEADPDAVALVAAGGREVTPLCRPYAGPTSTQDMAACLAVVVDACADGDVLLIDSHLTQRAEYDFVRSIPTGLTGRATGLWGALLAIPVAAAPTPPALDAALVPDDAAWLRDFCR